MKLKNSKNNLKGTAIKKIREKMHIKSTIGQTETRVLEKFQSFIFYSSGEIALPIIKLFVLGKIF